MDLAGIPDSWRYLENASPQMLQSFELSRLNFAANLRKQVESLISQYLEEALSAMLARCLLDLQNSAETPANQRTTPAVRSLAAPSQLLYRATLLIPPTSRFSAKNAPYPRALPSECIPSRNPLAAENVPQRTAAGSFPG